MRCDQRNTVLFGKLRIQPIAVVGAIADQIFGFGIQHVEVETQLHQRHFVMVGRVRADRQGQPVPIHDRQDFRAFAAFGRPHFSTAALGESKRGIDVTLALVERALLAQIIGQISQDPAQDLLPAPLLEPAMHRLVVGIALRKHVPLRAGVEHPQHRIEHFARRHRLASGAIIGMVFLGKMLPDPFPMRIAQSLHGAIVDIASPAANDFEIGSTWNTGAERIKGYSAQEIIGQPFERFFIEEDRAAGVPSRLLNSARATGRYESEGLRLRKDGSRFRAHAVVNALYDNSGKVVGFAKITRDITARVESENNLRQMQNQLVQSQKMGALGQLTGGTAHDFNNALAIIVSALQLAERAIDRGDTDRVRKFVADAIESAQNAGELVRRLLAFSRQQPLSPKPLDVNGLVRNMSEILRRTLGEHGKVETDLAGGLWNIKVIQKQLESALINLATNARDAMPDGGSLTIETSNAHLDDHYAAEHMNVPAGQYVLLAVSDTGVGMTSEQISKAFEPFFTTKGVGRGTGLGLAQVYGFLQQSGAHARIYSEGGHGTTVKLYFPRFMGPLEREPATSSEAVPLGTHDETILLVEDQPSVRRLTAQGLRELGY